MNREKQIEEMGKIILGTILLSRRKKRNSCKYGFGGMCAEALYDKGYGDTKQAVKEFAEKLKEKVEKAEEEIVPKGCDSYFKNGAMCCQSIIFLILDELVKEVCGD